MESISHALAVRPQVLDCAPWQLQDEVERIFAGDVFTAKTTLEFAAHLVVLDVMVRFGSKADAPARTTSAIGQERKWDLMRLSQYLA